ncbi:MAG: DUF5312 domain-containing protein [Treponema sp.]|jgi:hypothetical protein|nr:DUF5312 domain-containing protein [Treponema sp.]
MAAVFLDKLFSLFGNVKDPEAGKKRQLRQLTKEVSGNKYARFYKPKNGEIQGALGKFFYDMYKVISPAQVFLQNADKSAQLKQIVVELFLDKNHREAVQRLSPESIEEQAKTTPIKNLGKSLKEDLAALSSAFNANRTADMDCCYNLILSMVKFVSFDFFFLLKKFDSNITERSFSYQPRFANIQGEYITEEIKDFLEVSFAVDPDQDWKSALQAIRIYKNGVDVIPFEHWKKVLLLLKDIRKSGILELIVRHIDKKPDWVSKPVLPDEHIAEAYLEAKRIDVKESVDKIVNSQKNAQVSALAKVIFGSAEIERTKYYTEKAGEIYIKKNFDGFVYAAAVNYLKAFLLDHFKKEFRELCDLLLVRGQWTTPQLSQQTSENFHLLMELSDKLIAFDETLSDSGENGSRLKAAIVKADRDKGQARYLALILKTVNEEAFNIINLATRSLIIVGRSLKNLLEDLQKPSHDLLMNWKELESLSEAPLTQRTSDAYKQIYYFVRMMQFYAKPVQTE